jgi:hypothetical protein
MSGNNTTETNQLTSVSVNNGSVAYIDQMISLRIFKLIDKLTGKMDIKSVLFLIGLIGADTFKNYIKKMIEASVTQITGIDFYSLFSNIFIINKNIREDKIDDENTLTLTYKPKDIFWNNLDKYSGLSFNCISNDIEQVSKNEYILYKNVCDFVIKHSDFECSIPNIIKLKYVCSKDDQRLDTCITETFEFKKDIDIINQIPFPNFVQSYDKNSFVELHSDNQCAFRSFQRKSKHLKSDTQICAILFSGRKAHEPIKFLKGYKLFGVDIDDDFNLYIKYVPRIILTDADKVKEWVDCNILQNKSNSCTLHLKSKNKSINLLESWTNFVKNLQKDSIDTFSSNNIKIYDLKIVETKEIIELSEDSIDSKKSTESSEPVKPNKKVITKKKIEESLINELYKDLSTLFLKEKDSFLLNSVLNRFKYNKNVYTNLGLPYKFGALLYGEPGTGKSSAINAIASFLQKDIYYLDLTNVKTNDDLKLLFNRVNKEKSTNGIIVIEDIDAMTDVVKARTSETVNTELTLECFLNLLQGTLTQDGTTFLITTNHIENLDPAFYRDGRFDIKLNLTACDHYQMNTIYSKFLNKQIPKELLVKLPEEKITPASFIQEMLPYILSPETEDSKILKKFIN